jgi:hypothetical protein
MGWADLHGTCCAWLHLFNVADFVCLLARAGGGQLQAQVPGGPHLHHALCDMVSYPGHMANAAPGCLPAH